MVILGATDDDFVKGITIFGNLWLKRLVKVIRRG